VAFIFQTTLILLLAAAMASAGENVLYTFSGGNDCAAYGSLILDPAGNLFGTTTGAFGSRGEVYELTNNSGTWTETVLYSFGVAPDGEAPEGGVVRDAAGNLYGTTSRGGANGGGTVYKLTQGSGGWTEAVIYSFTGGADGASPEGSLAMDAAGNLYGTATFGGASNNGVVYELSPASGSWTQTVLYSFTGANDGGQPLAGPILDPAGNLYGTASQVNQDDTGVAYKLTPGSAGWTYGVLYSFTLGNDGGDTEGPLTRDQSGAIYGPANAGGTGNAGVVFKLRPGMFTPPSLPAGWNEEVLYNFTGGDDGNGPNTGVVFDQAGNLDGATSQGGSGGFGVIYQLTPGSPSWSENVLYTFTGGADGGFPESTIALDSSGNIYGTTVAGGNRCGVVYQITAPAR
jgi:uncharacterized repeat protein (TIGR03803 family)